MAPTTTSPFPDYFAIKALLSEEQTLVSQTVRDFATRELAPSIAENFRQEVFPEKVIPKLGALGLLGANLSGYGLPGMDHISYGLVMKELERVDSGLRSFVSVQGALVMFPIHRYGSEEQKSYWLPRLGRGESIGCFGLTEADGGSDPGAMKTTAEHKGDHWELNGAKMWITNGNLAQVAVVWAKTKEGIRGFLVPIPSPGLTVKKMSGKLSMRASITSELYFDRIKLPLSALLPKSEGLKSALGCLTQARYGIAWGVLGAAEACFDEACSYVKDRILFGEALASKQLVQRKLALMLSRITQGQLLALRLGQLKNQEQLHYGQVSMAKQNNCALALDVARECRDILGANGIMEEYSVMRHLCNLETVITYEGTNDIHLLILGAEITGKAAF
jgi:glutaryl-CoA dehydrogenase